MLRFTGTIVAGLYTDAANGVPAHHEPYDLREDPGESHDLFKQLPAVVDRLQKLYQAEAKF